MRRAGRGQADAVTHRWLRTRRIVDRPQHGGAVRAQSRARGGVDRGERIEQQRARDQHTRMTEHQIEVRAVGGHD